MRKGNKGEWSELYTFLKLLSDGKIYAADENLEKIDDIYYPLVKILRWEKNGALEYIYTDQMIILKDVATNNSVKIPIDAFKEKSSQLLSKIKNAKGSSFTFNEIEDFLDAIEYRTLKAHSNDKSDIRIMVHDSRTGMKPELGFSIKSRLGRASTLFNAGKTTNFVYRLDGNVDHNDMLEVNGIHSQRNKIRDRIDRMQEKDLKLNFNTISSDMFHLNLQIIDSSLPIILSSMLKYYYSGKASKVSDLLELVKKENPCNYNGSLGHDFYEYKIKGFLRDIALGMTPSKKWNGNFDATGGYIVVKENGEILCYHIYNHNEFQEYLLKHTKFDSPSSTRHEYGVIYENNGEFFFNLNLQIRFI